MIKSNINLATSPLHQNRHPYRYVEDCARFHVLFPLIDSLFTRTKTPD